MVDERYYMLGLLGLLLLVLIAYLLAATARYRRAVRNEREERVIADESKPKYLDSGQRAWSDALAAPTRSDAPAPEPSVNPSASVVPQAPVRPEPIPTPPAAAAPPAPSRPEPIGPPVARVEASAPTPEPVTVPEDMPSAPATPQPEPRIEREPESEPLPGPPAESAPELQVESEPESASVPEAQIEEAPEEEPSLAELLAAADVPIAPTPAKPAASDAVASGAVHEPMSSPTAQREPEPAPAESSRPPGSTETPASQYSLSEELERLIAAAVESAPLLTADEHAQVVPPTTPGRDSRPAPSIPRDDVSAKPSVGQALSSAPAAAPTRSPQPTPAPTPAVPAIPAPTPAPAAQPAPQPAPPRTTPAGPIPEYELVAPVELHFTIGDSRIGVKPGTRSFAEFQRLAGILLSDLRSARGW